MKKFTTMEMEVELIKYFKPLVNLVGLRVSPMSGLTYFEADLLSVTKSGYATCVEIKISKSDLKNDSKKAQINESISDINGGSKFWFKNFKYFYYAVPEHLVDFAIKKIPEFAGLLKVYQTHSGDNRTWTHVSEVRKPQHLNSTKWTDGMMFKLARLSTIKVLNLQQKIIKLTKLT
jgi:hypothetical protein